MSIKIKRWATLVCGLLVLGALSYTMLFLLYPEVASPTEFGYTTLWRARVSAATVSAFVSAEAGLCITLVDRLQGRSSVRRFFYVVVLTETAAILYAVFNVMFGTPFGSGFFFLEFRTVTFVLEFAPIISIGSGALAVLFPRPGKSMTA